MYKILLLGKLPPKRLAEHLQKEISFTQRILDYTQPKGYLEGITAEQLSRQFLVLFMTSTYISKFHLGDFELFMATQIKILVDGIETTTK